MTPATGDLSAMAGYNS